MQLSPRCYVSGLETALIRALAAWGLRGERTEHTGVWVGDRKIAALGVQVTRGMTAHGLALNCDPDLAWFGHIVPCGLVGKGVGSLATLAAPAPGSPPATVAAAAPVVTAALAASFAMQAHPPVRVAGAAALLCSLGLQ